MLTDVCSTLPATNFPHEFSSIMLSDACLRFQLVFTHDYLQSLLWKYLITNYPCSSAVHKIARLNWGWRPQGPRYTLQEILGAISSIIGVCHLFERKKESNLELQWKLFSSTKKSLFGCSATFRPWFSLAGDCESGKMASGHSSLGKVCKLQYSQQWLNGSLILSPVMFS